MIPRERWRFARLDRWPRGSRPASHPHGRRLREGPSLPDHLYRRGRARARAVHGGAARRGLLAQAWRDRRGQSRARRAPLGVRLRPLADGAPPPHLRLRGPQPRRGGARGARRDLRQCRGRDAGRVQPALRPELEGPEQHDGAPVPVHRPARHRSRHGDEGRAPRAARRAGQPAARLLHEHLGRVPPRRRLAPAHRSRRHARRAAWPQCPRLSLRGHRARARRVAAQPGPDRARRPDGRRGQVAESPRRGGLLRAAPRRPGQPRPLGDRGRGAAAEPTSAARRRDRGAARPARPRLRPHPPVELSAHHARPRRLDWSTLPPRPGRAFGSLVSAVDADGNEVAGIVLPEVAVPIATHTGWTLRHPDIGGAEQLLVFAGATLPFPRTRAERARVGRPAHLGRGALRLARGVSGAGAAAGRDRARGEAVISWRRTSTCRWQRPRASGILSPIQTGSTEESHDVQPGRAVPDPARDRQGGEAQPRPRPVGLPHGRHRDRDHAPPQPPVPGFPRPPPARAARRARGGRHVHPLRPAACGCP